jgi:subtilisin
MSSMSARRPSALVHLLAILALAATVAAPADALVQRPGVGPSETGRYVVVVDDGVDPAAVAADHRVTPAHVYRSAVNGFVSGASERRARALQADDRVLWVEGETIERIQGQTLPTGIDRIETDRNPAVTTDGSSGDDDLQLEDFHIAILDTGIYAGHEDLNVLGGRNFANGPPRNWGDGHGHGTHVAGTVAAIDNGTGVVGVAPGASLWSVRVCGNSGFCMSGDIIAGIDWVAEQKRGGAIDFAAANFSISSQDSDNGCDSPANATHAAICDLVDEGVVFVMAAGNDNRVKVPYPVAFSVSAIADFDGKAGGAGEPTCRQDIDDTLANFSNHGEKVDIAAPGVCILSTWNDGGYREISGTSMATPHVTGAVALYLHAKGLTPAEDASEVTAIENAIIGAAHPQGTDNHKCSYDDSRIGGPLLFVNATAFGGDGSCAVAGEEEPEATGTITGTITDADSGDPIDRASVVLEGAGLSTTTAGDGSYTIEDVPEGTHDVTASAEGYDSQTEQALIAEDATTTLDFALTPTDEPDEPEAGTVTVDSIEYATNGRWHLRVIVSVADVDSDDGIEGATVAITLSDTEGQGVERSATGTTGGDGTVTFQFNHALRDAGCYTTTVDDVNGDLDWDGGYPEDTSNCG